MATVTITIDPTDTQDGMRYTLPRAEVLDQTSEYSSTEIGSLQQESVRVYTDLTTDWSIRNYGGHTFEVLPSKRTQIRNALSDRGYDEDDVDDLADDILDILKESK